MAHGKGLAERHKHMVCVDDVEVALQDEGLPRHVICSGGPASSHQMT